MGAAAKREVDGAGHSTECAPRGRAMKFGKQLQATLVQDWGNHYVDYKSMKQLIKDSTSDEPAVRLQKFVALLASQLEQVNKAVVLRLWLTK